MNTKVCKQCGQLKPIEQFRKYYGGRKGHYNTCKVCEKINARRKYLVAKGESINWQEEAELGKINKLYEVQRAAGLQPPREASGRSTTLADSLDDMIASYKPAQSCVVLERNELGIWINEPSTHNVPADLLVWLSCELTEDPDYYLDEVYEELKDKYRPTLRIDKATLKPVYDDTYKDVLDKVLDRFYRYEEDYWEED